MIFNISKRRYLSGVFLVFLCILISLAACSDKDEPEAIGDTLPDDSASVPDVTEVIVEPEVSYPVEYSEAVATADAPMAAESEGSSKFNEFSVVLGADEKIQIPGVPGELRVWIGGSEFKPDFSDSMVKDEATIPALGESAKVEPFAPAFEIAPVESQCIRIHSTGSEVRFKLIPQKKGIFEVSANVFLFDSTDCSGSPVPKTVAALEVMVEVDQKAAVIEKGQELMDVLWEKFVEFWAALLAAFFGVMLFLFRGKLKKRFGHGGDG